MPTSVTRLSRASTHRNTPDTDAPITPVTSCSRELSSTTWPVRARTPKASITDRPNTIVEWPRLNQNPTDSGLRISSGGVPSASRAALSAISLRVALSTAAMWSASKACRKPKV